MPSRPRFGKSHPGLPDETALWDAFALLAKWFHFQPSEIYELDWDDFARWVKLAVRQIRAAR
jgi:hypothetical protein